MIAFTPGGVQVPISVRTGLGGKQLLSKLHSKGLMTSAEYLMSNLVRRAMAQRDPVDTPPTPEQDKPGWFRRNWKRLAGIGGAALIGGLGTAAFKKWGIPALSNLNEKYDVTGKVASKFDEMKELVRERFRRPPPMATDEVIIQNLREPIYDESVAVDPRE